MTQIFAYIPFKNGKAEDVALEYPEAAKKIDPSASSSASKDSTISQRLSVKHPLF